MRFGVSCRFSVGTRDWVQMSDVEFPFSETCTDYGVSPLPSFSCSLRAIRVKTARRYPEQFTETCAGKRAILVLLRELSKPNLAYTSS
jgi:hypothetical protein